MLQFSRNLIDFQTILDLDLDHQLLLQFHNLVELMSVILEAYSGIELLLQIKQHHLNFMIFLFQEIWFFNEEKEYE